MIFIFTKFRGTMNTAHRKIWNSKQAMRREETMSLILDMLDIEWDLNEKY